MVENTWFFSNVMANYYSLVQQCRMPDPSLPLAHIYQMQQSLTNWLFSFEILQKPQKLSALLAQKLGR